MSDRGFALSKSEGVAGTGVRREQGAKRVVLEEGGVETKTGCREGREVGWGRCHYRNIYIFIRFKGKNAVNNYGIILIFFKQ